MFTQQIKFMEDISQISSQYISSAINAQDFAKELVKYMTDDIIFWSNYTPSWDPLIKRYDYEKI